MPTGMKMSTTGMPNFSQSVKPSPIWAAAMALGSAHQGADAADAGAAGDTGRDEDQARRSQNIEALEQCRGRSGIIMAAVAVRC